MRLRVGSSDSLAEGAVVGGSAEGEIAILPELLDQAKLGTERVHLVPTPPLSVVELVVVILALCIHMEMITYHSRCTYVLARARHAQGTLQG